MKIKDLSSDLIEQLVELECINILPILASVGINLTPQHMREQLDIFRESDVVISQENGDVDGFVMYKADGPEVTIVSFNLKKFNNGKILSNLLAEVFRNLQDDAINIIRSHAHHTNIKSLNFHRRMGFKEVGRTEHYVEFQISKDDLLAMIEKRVRR
ncbi:hypothetical protein D3C87_189070 [compost metagenome]